MSRFFTASPLVIVGLAAATALLLAVVPVVGVPLAFVEIVAVVLRFPGAVIAISWSGFWLYLGALELLDIRTRTAFTVVAYTGIAIALTAFIWSRRRLLIGRLRRSTPIARTWLIAAGLLVVSFTVGSLIVGHGPLAHRLLGVFLISTIPTAIAVGATTRDDLIEARTALVILSVVFVVIDLAASRHGAPAIGRFSPITDLDPISASLVGAIGCLAVLSYRPASARATILQVAASIMLAAGVALNGSRGPAVALIFAIIVVVLSERNRRIVVVAAAAAIGLFAGSSLERQQIGQPAPLTSLVHEATKPSQPQQPEVTSIPLSSLNIRRQWFMTALRKAPDKPLLGHGVGMLVDDTPEAAAMGIKGELVYPHNDAVEAAFSLGTPGVVLFAIFLALPIAVLWRRRRALRQERFALALGLFAFAFAESNFSGEIGTDVVLWSLALFAVFVLDENAGPADPDPGASPA